MSIFAFRGRLAIAGSLVSGAVVIEGDRIAAVLTDPRDGNLPADVRQAAIIAPGLIDLQVNGGWGVEIGPDASAFCTLSAQLPATGVTSWLPTFITHPAADYPAVFAAYHDAVSGPGAAPVGLHLEGPFLAPARKGAHRIDWIGAAAANDALLEQFAAEPAVRLVTLAPEVPGGLNRIARLVEAGIVVSLGHSDATYEDVATAIDAGATMVTHLFNAMSPLGHRAPGLAGSALASDRLIAGLIADGIHVHAAALQIAIRAKGPERIALVSDMMSAAGMPPGGYELGGQSVITDGIAARLPDGTLAGAVLTMDQAVRNIAVWTNCGPAAAIRMATETPAASLRLTDRGTLAPGARADLCLFDETLHVVGTVIGGRTS